MNNIFYLTGQETSGELLALRRSVVRQRRQRQAAMADTRPYRTAGNTEKLNSRYYVPEYPFTA